ncbi:hypothetical protein BDV40DRAFT_271320 [Aspergillus tamarii]|uniref:Uncharacterized protein n=1 Tax=Aspergillus tamarii TaxID=41984 RepID=A0A5N6UNZ1_ASPTM|nr:hypothetical protein BDV40DRAFT_271320 [Aspergillus tamarii]
MTCMERYQRDQRTCLDCGDLLRYYPAKIATWKSTTTYLLVSFVSFFNVLPFALTVPGSKIRSVPT